MITARLIAEFIELLEQEEAAQTQLMSAAENKQIVTLINHNQAEQAPLNDPNQTEQPTGAGGQIQSQVEDGDDEPLPPLEDYQV